METKWISRQPMWLQRTLLILLITLPVAGMLFYAINDYESMVKISFKISAVLLLGIPLLIAVIGLFVIVLTRLFGR